VSAPRHGARLRLVRALLDGNIPPDEILKAHDIYTTLCDLGPDLLGMVYRSGRLRYHIVVNSWLEPEERTQVWLHELKHVLVDMPQHSYLVGVDMLEEKAERQADRFSERVLRVVSGSMAAER